MHTERTVRGYSHLLLARFVEERLAPHEAVAVKSKLGDAWERLPSIREDSQAPFDDWTGMLRAIAELHEDPTARYERVFEAGKFVANHALSTALRLLVRFLRPSMFARKVSDLWKRDHNFGSLTATMGEAPNTMVVDLAGVDDYWYVAPVAAGWVTAALETMGCKQVTWHETLNPPPAPQNAERYKLELSWQ